MGDRATDRATSSWTVCACGRTLARGAFARGVTAIRERGCPPGACLPHVGKTLDPAVWRALRLKPVVVAIERD